ncbi:hypothetical protein FSP39_003795 [Pinctada imbricata]|uniref:Uncharacterized protein n=1 Tax=Pinctada imbricata TaxID=66713 RepID=A0AA88YKP2_PINIB|nr:hypothetical protein FSP39_003795 [Pinctada imbricata]
MRLTGMPVVTQFGASYWDACSHSLVRLTEMPAVTQFDASYWDTCSHKDWCLIPLRPVLECRMPTLTTRQAFLVSLQEDMPKPKEKLRGLKRLEISPPRSLRDLRNIISSELRNVSKKLSRLERAYYGIGKSLQDEG